MALIIVFYSTVGAAAKQRVREIVAQKHHARIYDVGVWDGTDDNCDAVEIMPDVPAWQVKRIVQVYGDKIIAGGPEQPKDALDVVETQNDSGANGGETQNDSGANGGEGTPPAQKAAVHRGAGKWFVMQGEDKISGPHTREEAEQLAAT